MSIIESMTNLWGNRQYRKLVLLSAFAAMLALILGYRLLNREEVTEGALRRVVCVECDFKVDQYVVDIDDARYKCPNCGGKLAYAWQCESCGFEYPMVRAKVTQAVPEKTMAKFRLAMELVKCPNCKSLSTAPMNAAEQSPPVP